MCPNPQSVGAAAGEVSSAKRRRVADEDEHSGSEAEALVALRAVDGAVGRAAGAGKKTMGGAAEACRWREALQKLRAAQQPLVRGEVPGAAGGARQKWDPDTLLAALKQSIAQEKWALLTAPATYPKAPDMNSAIARLEVGEIARALRVCLGSHEADPRTRFAAGLWITHLLEAGGPQVLAQPDVCEALNAFVAALDRRLGSAGAANEVHTCLGKWRYIRELADMRRATQAAGAEEDAEAAVTAPAPGDDQSEASDLDGEDQ